MKRRWTITLIVILAVAAAVPACKYWPRTTDDSGPYVELMVGVYTDNQPDFTYLLPYEAKALFEGMRAFAEKGLATPFKIDCTASAYSTPPPWNSLTSLSKIILTNCYNNSP